MRFARPLTPIFLLAALLAGCGGNQIAADEVPVDPPVLTVPSDEDAAPGASGTADDADAAADADQDADADATPTPEAGTTGGGTTGGTTGAAATPAPGTGGAAATPTPQAQTPENTGGAQADEGLDQFCADNPGAC